MGADDRRADGLMFDLPRLINRRTALRLLGGAGLGVLAACSRSTPRAASTPTTIASATNTATAGSTTAACVEIPSETGGPFPGDGSNGPDVLTESGVVRGDIRSSFAGSSGVAAGVPLAINLAIVDASKACAPLQGAAMYLWHCDREGRYSLYSQGATDQNYLRGVQAADSKGLLTFESIFPACYSGRWPHIHFEIYKSIADATGRGTLLKTTQLALPQAVCKEVYGTSGYEQSVRNLAQVSLDRDLVFADGYQTQLATVTGDVSSQLVANLTVPV